MKYTLYLINKDGKEISLDFKSLIEFENSFKLWKKSGGINRNRVIKAFLINNYNKEVKEYRV